MSARTFEPSDRVRVHAPEGAFHGLTGTVEADDPDFPVADVGGDVWVALDEAVSATVPMAAYEFTFAELRSAS